jgi:hypothetical protein
MWKNIREAPETNPEWPERGNKFVMCHALGTGSKATSKRGGAVESEPVPMKKTTVPEKRKPLHGSQTEAS